MELILIAVIVLNIFVIRGIILRRGVVGGLGYVPNVLKFYMAEVRNKNAKEQVSFAL